MTESDFRDILEQTINKSLPDDYEISCKENLLYKIIVDEDGKFRPKSPVNLTRGNLSFQTDLLIKRDGLALVVAEIKYGSFTTHDILTYSVKALKAQRHLSLPAVRSNSWWIKDYR